MTTFSSRSPTYFLPLPPKVITEVTRPEILKPLIKYKESLDGNPVSRNKYYKRLSNIQTDNFDFIYNDNTVIKSGNVHCDDCASKIMFIFQESQEPKINHTIEQESTDDLSICNTRKNSDSSSSAKSELKTLEIKQQESRNQFKLQDNQYSRKYDSSQSPEFRNYTRKDLSQTSRYVLQTPTSTSKPLPSVFETLKTSSRFDYLAFSESLGNQGFRKTSLCLPSVPRRIFSSKSCTVIQQSIRKFENLKNDQSANTSIIRLRNTRSHPDRVSLMRLQSFSCDTSKSKKSVDCEKDDKSQRSKCEDEIEEDHACSQEIARSRCQIKSKKICGKTRRKDTCVSSPNDVGEEQREKKPKLNKNYTCPELRRPKPCTWKEERCPETRRKCDENKARISSKDCALQSREPSCSQKQDIDRRCNKRRQSKSYKQRDDCQKADESHAVCKDSMKKTDEFESKCKKQRVKCNISEKKRRKCTGNNRKRSNSYRKRNSSRTSDKSCSKVDGKRYYSTSDVTKQSIFFVPRDRKSFSTSISDIILGINISKRFYASCSKDDKDRRQAPSCEKPKMKCEIKEKEEIEKKCMKGTAKCMSRKKTTDKTQTCQSTKKDKDKKFCESTKKSRQEFCASRKKELTKDKKLKKEPVKAPPSPVKDEKSMEQLMKEQIDREYKEIDECKKGFKKEKKGDKIKMVSSEKPTGLDRIINSCKKQEKDIEKFVSTRNESIISTDAVFKWFNIQSRIINGTIPIIAKDVGLFNVMFDRSFSTVKLDYQDDFAIGRAMNDDKIVQNCSANGEDFIHGDELPNYIEIEYEDEEDDVHEDH
ncbi:hypothetical protein ALC60_07211 [Trachymyrmex zeteki]|uniref:Uncharacterized protein n=2 Tax=Mycetomoellerius zeteki TaxID=64791 RepID=A0A151X0F8_9HYME|nr:hypothetical protein ALC60_07211 [Trachymyrmex zeteki]